MILALEATDRGGSVALADDGGLRSLRYLESARTHSERLMESVESMLAQHEIGYRGVDCFACARGPGSFTAIRLAVTTAKTLALAAGRPLVTVSTLRLMAEWVHPATTPIRVLLDARRGQFYHQVFEQGEPGLRAQTEPELVTPERLRSRVDDRTETVVSRQRDQSLDPSRWPAAWRWYPEVQSRSLSVPLVGMIQREDPEAEAGDPDRVRPLYVRKSDAQRSRERDEVTV